MPHVYGTPCIFSDDEDLEHEDITPIDPENQCLNRNEYEFEVKAGSKTHDHIAERSADFS